MFRDLESRMGRGGEEAKAMRKHGQIVAISII